MTSHRQALIGPAIGLVLTGLVACLTPFVPFVVTSLDAAMMRLSWGPFLSLFWFLGPLFGLPILWGAYLMLRLEAYWYVRVTCVLAMLPGSPHILIGLPVGVWGMRVLDRPEVRAAFERRLANYQAAMEQALEEYDADLREP